MTFLGFREGDILRRENSARGRSHKNTALTITEGMKVNIL